MTARLLCKFLVIVWLFWTGGEGAAIAGPIAYKHTVVAGKQATSGPFPGLIASGASLSRTFHLIDAGFDPFTREIRAATVALHFKDDGGLMDFYEYASFKLGANAFHFEVSDGISSFTLNSLSALTNTGKWNAIPTAADGDFYFKPAALTAKAFNRSTAAPDRVIRLPEPANLGLFGMSLLALAFSRTPRIHRRSACKDVA